MRFAHGGSVADLQRGRNREHDCDFYGFCVAGVGNAGLGVDTTGRFLGDATGEIDAGVAGVGVPIRPGVEAGSGHAWKYDNPLKSALIPETTTAIHATRCVRL